MKLQQVVEAIRDQLEQQDLCVVFAESCTAGLLSAKLAAVPGISQWLCGSAVTYREATKTRWLGVPVELLAEHSAVSAEASAAMAHGVLKSTPEASLALAITGHLGPGAPEPIDGAVFVATARRSGDNSTELIARQRIDLRADERLARQTEAAERALDILLETLLQLPRRPSRDEYSK